MGLFGKGKKKTNQVDNLKKAIEDANKKSPATKKANKAWGTTDPKK